MLLFIISLLSIVISFVVFHNTTTPTTNTTVMKSDMDKIKEAEQTGSKVEWLERGYNGEWIIYRGGVDMGGRLFPEQKLYQSQHKVRATLWAKDNRIELV